MSDGFQEPVNFDDGFDPPVDSGGATNAGTGSEMSRLGNFRSTLQERLNAIPEVRSRLTRKHLSPVRAQT